MKFFTQLTGFLIVSFLIVSCEYSAEVYTINETISSDVYHIVDETKFEQIEDRAQPVEIKYVHNNLSFDVANSGNAIAYNVEVEVSVITDKINETIEILYLDELKPKEIRRMHMKRILIDEYFKEYYINVYWDSEDDY